MKKINNSIGIYVKDSHMWGCLFLDFLNKQSIPYKIIHNPYENELKGVKILILPGGFASERAKGLGKEGIKAIKEYVRSGGIYFGVCGGAGLCLNEGEYSLGISHLKRKKMADRVPNFSGHIKVNFTKNFFDIFGQKGIKKNLGLPVWWPSQFQWDESKDVKKIARYEKPLDDLWIADIPYYTLNDMDIHEVEKLYGINLDFSYIKNEPCIVMGDFGKGRYFLTYPHLETPGSKEANNLLVHIFSYFLQKDFRAKQIDAIDLCSPKIKWDDKTFLFIFNGLHELILKAQENFLMCWRKKWLLGWRRGVIGLSINSILYMICFLLERTPSYACITLWQDIKEELKLLFLNFKREFEKYIIMQREFYLKNSHRAPDRFGDKPIHKQILKLTGPFPGHGGIFKKIVVHLEKLVSALNRSFYK